VSQLLAEEFELQVKNLVEKGCPEAAGISLGQFLDHIEPLKEKLGSVPESGLDIEQGYIPFVIVIKSELVSIEKAMSMVEHNSKSGFISMYPVEPGSFEPIETINIPDPLLIY